MKKVGLILSLLLLMVSAVFGVYVEIGDGTTSTKYAPFYGNYDYSWSNYILTADQIGPAGIINEVKFDVANSPANYQTNNQQVYLRLTTVSSVIYDYPNPVNNSFTLVYNGSVTWSGSGWQGIVLNTEFNYDGTSNLQIVWENHDGSYASGYPEFFKTDTSEDRTAASFTDNSFPTSDGPTKKFYPNTRLGFSSITPTAPTLVAPANYSFNIDSNTNLTWNNGVNTEFIKVYLSTNKAEVVNNSGNALVLDGGLATTCSPSLEPASTYFWKVVASNSTSINAAQTPIHKFTTVPPAGTIQIGGGDTVDQGLPIDPYWGYTYSQTIYPQADVNKQGDISKVAWNYNGSHAWGPEAVKIYMGHTTKTIFDSRTDWINIEDLILVFEGNITATAIEGWVAITLDSPFSYNNVSNLVIAVDENSPGYYFTNDDFYSTAATGDVSLMYRSDGINPDPASPPYATLRAYYPNTRLEFSPTTPTIVAPANYSINIDSDTSLEWINGANTDFIKVYLSTEEAAVINSSQTALVLDGGLATAFSPSLEPASTYYWKVVASNSTSINVAETPLYKFTTAMPENSIQIGDGTVVDKGLPIDPYYGHTYSQTIYPQTDVNNQGDINALAWNYNGNSAWGPEALKIYMGHTTETTFAVNTSWINVEDLTLVYDGNITVPAISGWIPITLDIPFYYNNQANLVIAAYEYTPSYYTSRDDFYSTATTGNVSLMFRADGTNPDPASPPNGSLVPYYPNLQLAMTNKITISGQITSSLADAGIPATVTLSGTENYSTTADAFGNYTISNIVTNSNYTLEVAYLGYVGYSSELSVGESYIELDVVLGDLVSPNNFVVDVNQGVVDLSWDAVSNSDRAFLGYNLYRNGILLNSEPLTANSYADYAIVHGETYSYYQTNILDEGESTASNIVEVLAVNYAGEGTEAQPYLINDLTDLRILSEYSWLWGSASHFEQTADIDAADTQNWNDGAGFSPIGIKGGTEFKGTYDGDNKTISNLFINRPDSGGIGLFGAINGATIKNLGLIANNISGGTYDVGGVAGVIKLSLISNCYTTGSVSGGSSVGNLIGASVGNSTISYSYATGTVMGTVNNTGGLIGWAEQSTIITDSYATGNVNGRSAVGGLVGYLRTNSSISSSYATGIVTGASSLGGLVGSTNSAVTVANSFWNTETTGQANSAAGVGKTTAEMKTLATYLNAGWDFVEETTNGTADIWTYYDNFYPHLTWEMFLAPDFTVSQETINLSESSEFTTLSVGTIDNYLWEFGDYNTSTEANPIHTYSQAGVYSVTLTISNANNTQAITKADYITVNDYPNISVNPSEFDVTLTAGESTTQSLIVTNNGQGWLNGSLRVSDNIMRSGTPEIIYGQARSSESISSGLRASKSLIPSTKNTTSSRSAGYSVLYVNSIDEDTVFLTGMNELSNVASFDEFNAEYGTPNVAYMLQYDLVIVSSDHAFNNPTLLGDNLASYCDAGGKLIVLEGSFCFGNAWALNGAIVGSDYLPLAVTDYDIEEATGTEFISHPITQGVSQVSTVLYALTDTQGDGVLLGTYTNGYPIAAYNPNKPIIAINVFPRDNYWGGDLIQLVSNTINWLGNTYDWLSLPETELSIAPGASQVISITLNSEELEAGVYTKLIKISSNDPDEPMLSIPVTMNVLEALVPDFVASETTIYLDESIEFTNLSTGSIDEYLWDFGDTNTSAEENPLHTYSQAGVYSVTLTISNATTSESLIKTDLITVLGFPDISVNPSEINVTLTVGDSETQDLIVTNNGIGWLNGSLSVGDNIMRSGTPEIIYGKARSSESTASGLRVSKNLIPSTKNITSSRSSGYSVLYVNAIHEDEDAMFTAAMNELDNVSEFTRFDAENMTPNVAYMLQYDVVIVASIYFFSNPALLGDNLASYSDAGGKIILLPATFYTEWGLGGAIAGSDYLPLAVTDYSNDYTSGTSFISHPITQGVSEISVTQYAYTHAQGDGIVLGSFASGSPIVAYNPNKPIIAINVCPPDGWWDGDFIQLISNSINWLTNVEWLTLSETNLSIAPGESTTITVTLNSEELEAGVYTKLIKISSNDPDEPLLNIPVTMNVLEALVPDFVASETTIYLDESIEFTNLSTGSINEYLWDFGDDNTSAEENPLHTYSQAGLYSVTLTITNALSNDLLTKTDYITVNDYPDISVNPSELNVSLTVGNSTTQDLIISNNGDGVLNYNISNSSFIRGKRDFEITSYHDKSTTRKSVNNNSLNKLQPKHDFSKQVYKSRDRTGGSENILYYEENSYNQYSSALDNLGYDRTVAYDLSDFFQELTNGTTWDLVIFNSYYNNLQPYMINNLNSYIENGGRLLFSYWGISGFYPSALLTNMGIEFVENYNTPLNFSAIDSQQTIFTNPNSVSEFFPNNVEASRNGQIVNAINGATQLAAFAGYPGSGAMVINSAKTTIFNAFYASNYTGDDNGNEKLDIVELIENQIEYLFVDSWLSTSAQTGSIAANTSQTITVTLNSEELEAGVYTKLIKISSNDPDEPLLNIPVTMNVLEELVSDFVASETTIYLDESILFTNLSTGSIDEYLWDFGDTNTSAEENPLHTYSQAGVYSVTLTISNATTSESLTKTDYITVQEEEEGDLLAPQNPAIAIINGIVELTWDEVTDPATGASIGNMLYTIYSSTEPSGTYRPLDTVSDLTWSDINNQVGDRRFYYIKAHTDIIRVSSEGFINAHRNITRDGKVIKSKK